MEPTQPSTRRCLNPMHMKKNPSISYRTKYYPTLIVLLLKVPRSRHISLRRRPRTWNVRLTAIVSSWTGLGHRLRVVVVVLSLVAVGRPTRHRRQSLSLSGFDLLHAREAVVLAMHSRDEVHDERGDVADVDEGDDPFEDGCAVVMCFVAHYTECCGLLVFDFLEGDLSWRTDCERDFNEDEGELDPE